MNNADAFTVRTDRDRSSSRDDVLAGLVRPPARRRFHSTPRAALHIPRQTGARKSSSKRIALLNHARTCRNVRTLRDKLTGESNVSLAATRPRLAICDLSAEKCERHLIYFLARQPCINVARRAFEQTNGVFPEDWSVVARNRHKYQSLNPRARVWTRDLHRNFEDIYIVGILKIRLILKWNYVALNEDKLVFNQNEYVKINTIKLTQLFSHRILQY